jgi:protein-L-isoaspartate(D-aspartate) O-methyltransferase
MGLKVNMKDDLAEYWIKSKIITDDKLIKAFEDTPREKFVKEEDIDDAYDDYPKTIGFDQTISQPTTVMIMIESLKLNNKDKVLEVGAGSGYCAAIMSRLAQKIITIEIIPELVEFAAQNLLKDNIKNVEIIQGDGSLGYEKEAPYDKIIVTAASPHLPQPLIDQLKEGGIIVAPVGGSFGQKMIKGVKNNGKLVTESMGYFTFVPLKGKFGYN